MRILLHRGCSRALFPSLHRPTAAVAASSFSCFSSSSTSSSSSFQLSNLMTATIPMTMAEAKDRRPGMSFSHADDHVNYSNHGGGRWGRTKAEQPVVVILGATGCGKSKLSIDLASRFSGEVVNTDKIQVYSGLEVTTNKIPAADRCGVPHHLLGEVDPATAGELPPAAFREMAARAVAGIAARCRLPVLAGGSNSFVYAALAGRYDPGWDLFAKTAEDERSRRRDEEEGLLRYRCCFLWVDVEEAALAEHLDRRVDEMVGEGMVDELGRYFAAEGPAPELRHPGLAKAIGVPEFRDYFHGQMRGTAAEHKAAVAAIKANTRRLAEEQVRKIRRLGEGGLGWELRRVDATAAVAAKLAGGEGVAEAWERDVVGPSVAAVKRFLREEEEWGKGQLVNAEAGSGGGHQQQQRQRHERHRRRIFVQAPALKVIG